MRIEKFEEIESTNEYMKLKSEAEEWDVVYAVLQTKGRGRNGKRWVSNEGGAWFTTVIKENKAVSMSEYVKLPMIIGAALLNTLNTLGINSCKIKWPNDIYVNDKKVCGILVEKSGENFIVGIGINVNIEKFDKEVENIATSLFIESNKKYKIEEIIISTVENIKNYYEIFLRGGWIGIIEIILKNDWLKGKNVDIISGSSIDNGVVKGINKNGEIEIVVSEKLKTYCSGEISIKNIKI